MSTQTQKLEFAHNMETEEFSVYTANNERRFLYSNKRGMFYKDGGKAIYLTEEETDRFYAFADKI
jgi:hypothetical protein